MDEDLMQLLQAQQQAQVADLSGDDMKQTLAELYKQQQEDEMMKRDMLKKQLEAHLASQATPIDWTPLAASLKEWTGSDAPLVGAKSMQAQSIADQERAQQLFDQLNNRKGPSSEWIARAALAQPGKELQTELKQEQLKKAKEGTEPQKAAAGYARRLEQSEQIFGKLANSGFNRASAEAAAQSKLPNAMKSGNLLSQEQAERNFINAVLRRESGAAISPTEFASAEQQYFPRLGDTPEVMAQKQANRQQVIETLKASAGQALGAVPLISVTPPKKAAPKAKPKTAAPAPVMTQDLSSMTDEELEALEKELTGG